MTAIARITDPSITYAAQQMPDIRRTLKNSLYPGASDASIDMVLAYCSAAGLDVMQKPVHIVPMWDSKAGHMRDVVMPGIGMYRVQASRSGEWAGVSEPEFGPLVYETIGGAEIEYPEWCRVTTRRLMRNGAIAEFTAIEYWRENYAVKGGKEKSIAPNAMWTKRPRGQLAKCAQAQSLRLAFPEIGAAPTAEEMEGKALDVDAVSADPRQVKMPQAKTAAVIAHETIEGDFTDAAPHGASEAAESRTSAPAQGEPSPGAGNDDELGPLSDLSPSQCRMVRAKAQYAGYADDDALLAAHPDLSKATINNVLKALAR